MTELLPTIWYVLIFVLLAGYAILDGFDLGRRTEDTPRRARTARLHSFLWDLGAFISK